MSKTEIYEKLLNFSMNTMSYEIYEDAVYHLLWMFDKIDPELQKFMFPEKEVKDVQLPDNNKL